MRSTPVHPLKVLPELLLAAKAADLLRLSRKQIYRLCRQKKLKSYRLERSLQIPKRSVLEYLGASGGKHSMNMGKVTRTPAELLVYLRSLGARFKIEGEALRVVAPRGRLTDELVHEIKFYKPILLAILKEHGDLPYEY